MRYNTSTKPAGTSETQIRETLHRWSLLYRHVNEKAVEIWLELFRGTEPGTLAEALEMVTRTSERMPTPGKLTEAIAAVQERNLPSTAWKYNYEEREAMGPDGDPVKVFVDPETGHHLYRAGDCPEGREFLEVLKKMAGQRCGL